MCVSVTLYYGLDIMMSLCSFVSHSCGPVDFQNQNETNITLGRSIKLNFLSINFARHGCVCYDTCTVLTSMTGSPSIAKLEGPACPRLAL